MDSLFSSELSLLGSVEGLREDGCGMGWSSSPLSEDMYPTSHFALAAAYHDIKTRLASLERENISIKHKLRNYEVKFPMISEFGEERSPCCSCEPKESSLMMSDSSSLQQKINSLTQELQKSKEREERLEDVIQAYEKIHLEKSNVQRDLDKMTSLAEQHVERIHGLEAALRQRDDSLQKLGSRVRSGKDSPQTQPHVRAKDMHHLQLHTSLDVPHECRGPTLQSSRSLDALSDLKVQRLEAELEGARHEAQGACQREEELKAELERLQEEIRQLQSQRQEMPTTCEHCDVEWIKKAGDEQVNLALAYTELTEELGRVRSLAAKQSEIFRQTAQEQQSPVLRHSPASQRCSPSSQRPSPSPDRLRPSPPISPTAGPASYTSRPPTSRLRERFQGRRSYSEMSDPSSHGRPPSHARLLCDPVSTLPKPHVMGGAGGYQRLPRASLAGTRPASAHGGSLGGGMGGSLGGSPARHHRGLELDLELAFPLMEMRHLCRLEDPSVVASLAPAPLVTPPQSSDEEEDWHCPSPVHSPPRTLGAVLPPCPPFPAPEGPSTLTCHLQGHLLADHAQSWPSINLWMETEENRARSCPLCQLTFPTDYPDDALIKHIDTHLENSKI
ncbi:TANK-binding kinase 1-binding protein 1-like isoform X1 [Alosa sapidissima]|uniref:TANK-binding kinase 1-binding protein 1-like isoform X1 n=2 Tax=Alosa sapidissima TaxID=34773 RepID=UPI001C09C09C|nr:TANK-binding kinase 1-binding protein 1-like isoform X1 [Alosa sapidissima]